MDDQLKPQSEIEDCSLPVIHVTGGILQKVKFIEGDPQRSLDGEYVAFEGNRHQEKPYYCRVCPETRKVISGRIYFNRQGWRITRGISFGGWNLSQKERENEKELNLDTPPFGLWEESKTSDLGDANYENEYTVVLTPISCTVKPAKR